MTRPALLVVATLALCLPAPLLAQHPDPYAPPPQEEASSRESQPQETFFDHVTVDEVSVVVRITDRRGEPILGLDAEDLDVRVDGESVPVDDLRWHSSDASTFAPEDGSKPEDSKRTSLSLAPRAPGASPSMSTSTSPRRGALQDARRSGAFDDDGKLVVLFVQIGHHQVVTFDESWVTGHMKALPSMERLLDELPATDRVAVVSFDAKFKLWQDFSRDREATLERLWQAVGFATPDTEPATDGPSLFESFDFEAAENTTSPEEALLVLGEALEAWREPKEIIFLGWGMGRLTGGMVSMPPVYDDALASLQRAQTTVHVLNVVQMEGNALASGLINVAEATGGTYGSTFDFGRRKIERLARVMGGYYMLSLDPSDFPGLAGKLEVRLAEETGLKPKNVWIQHRRMVVEGSS